jgi:chromosome segregation ATPase
MPSNLNPTDAAVIQEQLKQIHGWMQEMRPAIMAIPALNERYNGFEHRLGELENRYAQSLDQVTASMGRVHQRIDEVRDEFRRTRDESRAETSAMLHKELSELRTSITDLKRESEATEKRLAAWVNRGKGAWWAIGVLAVVFGSAFTYVISDITAAHDWRIRVTEMLRNKGMADLNLPVR